MGPKILAAVEGGGTSFVVTIAVLRSSEIENTTIPHTRFEILCEEVIPSHSPSETITDTCNFLKKYSPVNGYDALGICCFGPLGVNENDTSSFGRILPGSPKKEWRNIDVLSPILESCSSKDGKHIPPYRLDTDVNAPAMAEFEYYKNTLHHNISSLAYVTVGTGIGVGLVINNESVHGMMHPEGGHVPICPLDDDNFAYSWGDKSPYKGRNTVEGIASSVALAERHFGKSHHGLHKARENLKELDDESVVWDHAANALANLCVTLCLITSVEKIVFGGGVMNRKILYQKVRERTRELLNGYLMLPQILNDDGLEAYVGPSVWSEEGESSPGIVGALVLAKLAFETKEPQKVEGKTVRFLKNVFRPSNFGYSVHMSGLILMGFLLMRNKK